MLTKKLSSVTLEKSEEKITSKMGLVWSYHCTEHFGLKSMTEEIFPSPQSNNGIDSWEKIMASSLNFIAGANRVEDLEVLRADKALVDSLGWESMISPDTLLDFCKNKKNGVYLRKLQEQMALKAIRESKIKELTYDNDATYIDSQKDCAEYSYQKEKQVSGLLGFIPELSGLCVTMDYRPGNISPATGILNQLRKACNLARSAGKRIKSFRSDSAAHNKEIFHYCNNNEIDYYVSLDKNAVVKMSIDEVKTNTWQEVPNQEGVEYAQSVYWSMDNTKEPIKHRILILRWINSEPTLFEEEKYCYHVIASNNWNIDALEWLSFHNGRMGSENFNKELKTGFSCDYVPSNDFNKSRNYFLLGVLSYNIVQILKLFYLGEKCKTWSIKRLRLWFIYTCGKFLSRSHKINCRIINATTTTFNIFENILSKIVYQ